MSRLELAARLVRILPEEWLPTIHDGDIVLNAYVDWNKRVIFIQREREADWFINWALDELAKKVLTPSLTFFPESEYPSGKVNPRGWQVAWDVPDEDPYFGNEFPTKTLALAHALVDEKEM